MEVEDGFKHNKGKDKRYSTPQHWVFKVSDIDNYNESATFLRRTESSSINNDERNSSSSTGMYLKKKGITNWIGFKKSKNKDEDDPSPNASSPSPQQVNFHSNDQVSLDNMKETNQTQSDNMMMQLKIKLLELEDGLYQCYNCNFGVYDNPNDYIDPTTRTQYLKPVRRTSSILNVFEKHLNHIKDQNYKFDPIQRFHSEGGGGGFSVYTACYKPSHKYQRFVKLCGTKLQQSNSSTQHQNLYLELKTLLLEVDKKLSLITFRLNDINQYFTSQLDNTSNALDKQHIAKQIVVNLLLDLQNFQDNMMDNDNEEEEEKEDTKDDIQVKSHFSIFLISYLFVFTY